MNAFLEIHREKDCGVYIDELKNLRYPPHFHSNIEIAYVLEGEINVNINGVSSVLKTGDIYSAIHYDIHSYYTETDSKIIILIVPCDLVKNFMSLISEKSFNTPFLISKSCSSEIFHYLKMLMAEMETPDNLLILIGYIYIILSILVKNLGLCNKKDSGISLIQKDVLVYLQENYLSKISLSELSEKFKFSKYHFSKFFNRYFGCGLPEYINTLRARHASVLLLESNMSIMAVAFESGFENNRALNRAFVKNFGMTPREYRFTYGNK